MEPRKSYNDGLCEMLRKMVGKTVFSTATRTIASEWSLCVTIGDAPPWLRADNWMLPIHAADAIERLAGDLELVTREVKRLRAERDALVEQRDRWIAGAQLHAARANQQPPEIRRHWDSADA